MDIYEHVRRSRIYSYTMTGFAIYWLSCCLDWIYNTINLDTVTPQAVALVGTVLAALVALLKYTYNFARCSKNNKEE